MKKSLTRAALMKRINSTFPKMPLRLGEDFRSDYKDTIWTGEDAGCASDDMSIFHYGSGYEDPCEKIWVLGVHRQLKTILDDAGWYAEFHDPGTVFLFRD